MKKSSKIIDRTAQMSRAGREEINALVTVFLSLSFSVGNGVGRFAPIPFQTRTGKHQAGTAQIINLF